MYAATYAFAISIAPSSLQDNRRTLVATLYFATGAIVGWPFALALAIPFVFEELFVYGKDVVIPASRTSWLLARWKRLTSVGLVAALLFVRNDMLSNLLRYDITLRSLDSYHWCRQPCLWQTFNSAMEYSFLQHVFVRARSKLIRDLSVVFLYLKPSSQFQHTPSFRSSFHSCSGCDFHC